MEVSESNVAELVSMGFDEAQAKGALETCGGNLDRAVDLLLGGGGISSNAAAPTATSAAGFASSDAIMVSSDISQYSVENGRSACTCIALTAATCFLQQMDKTSAKESGGDAQEDDETVVTREFLQNMVTKGVETYQNLSRETSVEHMSAEEVLDQHVPEFSQLTLEGGVRQGILSSDRNHPLGLRALLEGVRQEATRPAKWMAVLTTKTPETVVVCLPPTNTDKFILLDSHPRHLFGDVAANGSYARIHNSLLDLVSSLESIFPQTDLGPGIPEMMAIMYNSFDLYPLTWRVSGES